MDRLPAGWQAGLDPRTKRIFFQDSRHSQWDHPTLGELPQPWILIQTPEGDEAYYNRLTFVCTKKDPRFMQLSTGEASNGPGAMASIRRNDSSAPLLCLERRAIRDDNIRDLFEVVKCIDDGEGAIGACNGGIYVVDLIDCWIQTTITNKFAGIHQERTTQEVVR